VLFSGVADYLPSPEGFVAEQVRLYEESGGTAGTDMRGFPVVVLTMRGAVTGALRKVPLMRVRYEDTYLAVGSNSGGPTDPLWVRNLMADPHLTLQDGPVVERRVARLVTGAEHDLWFARAVAIFRHYATYEETAGRPIPLFLLEPPA
jgi:deazaflavin-dependent oxidoreductase (nitroreductase family)